MKPKVQRKKLQSMQRWILVLALLVVVLLIPARALAGPPSPLIPASQGAAEIAKLFYLVLAIALVVFVFVEGLLVYAIFRYRRREGEDEQPEQIHGNATLEIMWTIVPAIIMAVLFVMTLRTLQTMRNAPRDSYQIAVEGHQWFWIFRYGDTGVTTQNVLHLPADRPVEFTITSKDVIHSFWVPQLGGKMDAIPGHVNTTWFVPDKPGTYAGECAEFCGLQHYAMLFDVVVEPQDTFDAWIFHEIELSKQTICPGEEPCKNVPDVATVPEGNAANGQALYDSKGCKSCHSLDGSPLVGPTFRGFSQRAAGRTLGESAQQYVAHSILRPCDFLAPGFPNCVMPQTFGSTLLPQELSDLIAFLMQQ